MTITLVRHIVPLAVLAITLRVVYLVVLHVVSYVEVHLVHGGGM